MSKEGKGELGRPGAAVAPAESSGKWFEITAEIEGGSVDGHFDLVSIVQEFAAIDIVMTVPGTGAANGGFRNHGRGKKQEKDASRYGKAYPETSVSRFPEKSKDRLPRNFPCTAEQSGREYAAVGPGGTIPGG